MMPKEKFWKFSKIITAESWQDSASYVPASPSSTFVQSTLTSVQTQNVLWRDNCPWGVKINEQYISVTFYDLDWKCCLVWLFISEVVNVDKWTLSRCRLWILCLMDFWDCDQLIVFFAQLWPSKIYINLVFRYTHRYILTQLSRSNILSIILDLYPSTQL